jgi:hypothetical protein
MGFERKYGVDYSDNRDRDRFNVELNNEERELFTNAQIYIQQCKDATALKQLAFLGWYAISSPEHFMKYLRDTLFKNERNNKRLGLDPKTEIETKFRLKKLK